MHKGNAITLIYCRPKSKLYLIGAIGLVVSPILANYSFFSQISIGDMLIFIFTPLLLGRIVFTPLTIINIILSALIILCSYFLLNGPDIYAGIYRAAFYYLFFMIIISSKDLKLPYFAKLYGGMVIIASLAVIFQWVAYTLFSKAIYLDLPMERYEPDALVVLDHTFRGGGLFREPSYFALYVMPYFIYSVFRRNIFHLFIISMAGILSTSTLMFFLILMALLIYLGLNLRLIYAGMVGILILSTLAILFSSGLFDGYAFVDKVSLIFTDGGTLNERFLPIFTIIGMSDSVMPSTQVLDFYLSANSWFNSAVSIVVYFGIGGLALLVLNILRINFIISTVFLVLVFSTHFLSSCFSIFIAIAFMVMGSSMSIMHSHKNSLT